MTGAGLRDRLLEDAGLIEQKLDALLTGRSMPSNLKEGMAYSLLGGGKRLRPALCLESCRMLGGNMESAAYAASALEMIHCYSLIHDDLPAMDDDAMRRGKPSNHVAFGEANAILAGDALLSLAFEVLSTYCRDGVTRIVAEGAFDMVSGQILDLSEPEGETALYAMHRLKTGALIRSSVLAGAGCADAAAEDIAALTDFSNAFGLLFQITDDILDATGDVQILGKTVGKDAKSGKLTFVSLYGLDGARERALTQAKLSAAALERFDARAAFFHALIGATLERKA